MSPHEKPDGGRVELGELRRELRLLKRQSQRARRLATSLFALEIAVLAALVAFSERLGG